MALRMAFKIYARIIDPVAGQFVTDEINVTNAQQSQYYGTLMLLLEAALQLTLGPTLCLLTLGRHPFRCGWHIKSS